MAVRKIFTTSKRTGSGTDSGAATSVSAMTAISKDVAASEDHCIICEEDGTGFYVYRYVATGTAATSAPDVYRPNDYTTGGNWLMQSSPFGTQMPRTDVVGPWGGIFGGDIVKSSGGDAELTISAYSCLDKTLKVQLYKDTPTVYTQATPAANQIYYGFIVKTTSNVHEIRFYTTFAGAAADATVSKWRLRTIWKTNGDSKFCTGVMVGNEIKWGKASEWAFPSALTNSFALPDHSTLVDMAYVKSIAYGVRDAGGSQGSVVSSIDDGTSVECYIGSGASATSDTDEYSWGSGQQKYLPNHSNRKFKVMTNAGKLCIAGVFLKL